MLQEAYLIPPPEVKLSPIHALRLAADIIDDFRREIEQDEFQDWQTIQRCDGAATDCIWFAEHMPSGYWKRELETDPGIVLRGLEHASMG